MDGMKKNNWEKAGKKRRAGVSLGLFSLYSSQSQGVGDLADLVTFINWASDAGLSVVQLLPMNEVGGVFCPYDAVSSFALEPFYLSLAALPAALRRGFNDRIASLKKTFAIQDGRLDYGVKDAKRGLLRDIYRRHGAQKPAGYASFCASGASWLNDYALYKVIKGIHRGSPWYDWPREYRDRDEQALSGIRAQYGDEYEFEKWVQWLLCGQLSAAHRAAQARGILMKGDLPLLVSRDSADVWAHPELFKLNHAAGAPPDMYCARGQRWGMPTYNWEAVAADGYRYIRDKLAFASQFYDILRIDHVVGLFRIWSIPGENDPQEAGLHGFFDPAEESLWAEHGRGLLSVMLSQSSMLLCAEDLGTIPPVTRQVLAALEIPGNDVQRWSKDWDGNHDFLSPDRYRPCAVAMLSTHDTTNWSAWWRYEAGTVDGDMFRRMCGDRGIDFHAVSAKLFDVERSAHGRLRWRQEIDSIDVFLWNLGRPRVEVEDFVGMYQDTYNEKQKLWSSLGFEGTVPGSADSALVREALRITLSSVSLLCVETMLDWLSLADLLPGDPYAWRINTPGTVNDRNWSLCLPLSLEELRGHPLKGKIRSLLQETRRLP